MADALLLRKLPVADPDALVSSHGGSYVLLQKIRQLHVVVINRALARFLFGDRDPVGLRIGLPTDRDPVSVVGVVDNVRHGTPRDARGVWYVPAAQYPALMRTMCIVVRTAGDPEPVASAVRRELTAIDAKMPILRIDTIGQQLDDVLVHERIVAGCATVFGALAMCIAAVGRYGIVWYSLARRTSEIGLRIALGARPATIVGATVRRILMRTAIGVGLAIPGAIAVAGVARSRLFGIGAADPQTIAAAAFAVGAVALVAAGIPAHRAARVSPAMALRAHE